MGSVGEKKIEIHFEKKLKKCFLFFGLWTFLVRGHEKKWPIVFLTSGFFGPKVGFLGFSDLARFLVPLKKKLKMEKVENLKKFFPFYRLL